MDGPTVITVSELKQHMKLKNIQILFPLKDKNKVVLRDHVTLVTPSIMQKLNGINTIIQQKVPNHRNTFAKVLTTVLHRQLFQILQKMLNPEKT